MVNSVCVCVVLKLAACALMWQSQSAFGDALSALQVCICISVHNRVCTRVCVCFASAQMAVLRRF